MTSAYIQGKLLADEVLGLHVKHATSDAAPAKHTSSKDHDKKDSRSKWLPLLAGLGVGGLAGLGTYAAMRRVKPTNNAYINKIRENADDQFTRVIDKVEPESAWQRLKDRWNLAGGGNVHYLGKQKYYPTTPEKIPGVLRYEDPSHSLFVRSSTGGAGGALPKHTKLMDKLNDKGLEYDYFNKHAPGTLGYSQHLDQIVKELGLKKPKTPAQTKAYMTAIQDELHKRFEGRFLLKETRGVQSAGEFPSDESNFNKLLKGYRESGGAAEARQAEKDLEKVYGGDDMQMMAALRENPHYSGRVLEDVIKKPKGVLAQERLDLQESDNPMRKFLAKHFDKSLSNEMRVHIENGSVVPELTQARYAPEASLFDRKHIHGANEYAQSVMDKLPHKDMNFAMDITPLEDGTYRMMESNPGGMSGFLHADSDTRPWDQGLNLRKHYMGNYAKPVAAAGAVGVGLAAGGATAAGLHHGMKPKPAPVLTQPEPSAPPLPALPATPR